MIILNNLFCVIFCSGQKPWTWWNTHGKTRENVKILNSFKWIFPSQHSTLNPLFNNEVWLFCTGSAVFYFVFLNREISSLSLAKDERQLFVSTSGPNKFDVSSFFVELSNYDTKGMLLRSYSWSYTHVINHTLNMLNHSMRK